MIECAGSAQVLAPGAQFVQPQLGDDDLVPAVALAGFDSLDGVVVGVQDNVPVVAGAARGASCDIKKPIVLGCGSV